MNKTLLFVALSLILPLHSKTLLNCSGDSTDDVIPSSDEKAHPLDPSSSEEEPDMKVVILDLHLETEGDLFYIRSQYNESKDIIALYRQNFNGIISLKSVYLGVNSLSDAEIMNGEGLKFDQSDSTAPLFGSSQYWHLFGQHGYVVPTVSNTAKLTNADVGSLWRDQMGRGYNVGKVTSSNITLLPVLGRDENGYEIRRWTSPNSPAIKSLSHVSGGVKVGTFEPSNVSYTQLRPLMESHNRKFFGDGKEITNVGTYMVNNLKVSELQLGYDPATIKQWFPTPLLSTAQVLAQFDWEYNFYGGQCSVHTSVDFRRSVEFQFYGATQQQTFYDTNGYKAFFIIPKAAPQNGIELDKPFHSPSSSSPNYSFYRTSSYLKDEDEPIDRIVAYLYDDVKGDYLLGMSAGLSLICGDTQTKKRVADLPPGNDNSHKRIGLFSPSNRNKFYIAAFTTALFEDNEYYVPNTFHREIDYYVSFFDPSQNTGQVYWYKDGDKYVIYLHCQSRHGHLDVQVPAFMNGCTLHVVEKSRGVDLKSTRIDKGQFAVAYASDDAEYIVLVAQK